MKKRLHERLLPSNLDKWQETPKLIKIKDGYLRHRIHMEYEHKKEVWCQEGSDGWREHFFTYDNTRIPHREDGPAKENIDYDGCRADFYFNGWHIQSVQQFCFLCDIDELETMMMVLKYGK